MSIEWPITFTENDKPFIGWIDLCNGTLFRFTAFKSLKPKPCLFVAIEGRGNYYFADNRSCKHPNYVAEKLSIPMADAEPLADWINTQLGVNDYMSFGDYVEIEHATDKYQLMGESEMPVLIPRIK